MHPGLDQLDGLHDGGGRLDLPQPGLDLLDDRGVSERLEPGQARGVGEDDRAQARAVDGAVVAQDALAELGDDRRWSAPPGPLELVDDHVGVDHAAPRSASIPATVLFPHAMLPVSPMTFIARCSSPKRLARDIVSPPRFTICGASPQRARGQEATTRRGNDPSVAERPPSGNRASKQRQSRGWEMESPPPQSGKRGWRDQVGTV